jgi:hypothetical protein
MVAPADAHRLRALALLAGSARGVTKSIMLMNGFTAELLAGLVRDGLATAELEHVRADERSIEVTRLRITDAGRRAIAASD